MDNKKIKIWEKHGILENAVLEQPPSEVSKIFKELGEVWITAFALGYACRYRGLDMVKVLVEGGATFKADPRTITELYGNVRPLPALPSSGDLSLMLISSVGLTYFKYMIKQDEEKGLKLLPLSERLEILDYLCGNAGKIGFRPDEFLFYALVSKEREMVLALKNSGVTLSERIAETVTAVSNTELWFDYCYLTMQLSGEDFAGVMSALISEIRETGIGGDKKLLCTDYFWRLNEEKLSKPGLFRFLLDNFDQSKMKKGDLMKGFINKENVSCLEIAAENGWLKQPRKRDEMIEYASGNGKAESAAWLLDFKNRTADLAAERKRAEKRQLRELNADPNSVTELKKIWSFTKREDGTLIITGYKGKNTEIAVPGKIGKDTVTAIDKYAFSPYAMRIRKEQRDLRYAVTEVKLPDSITEIGEFAFYQCKSLARIELPPLLTEISKGMLDLTAISSIRIGGSVKKIGAVAFHCCEHLKTAAICEGVEEIDQSAFGNCGSLKTVELPKSLKKMAAGDGSGSFAGCGSLTAVLHKGSYAERYCAENKIPFTYAK